MCGIANALDGTEDDAVYEEEMPEFADEEDEEMDDEFATDSEDDEQ